VSQNHFLFPQFQYKQDYQIGGIKMNKGNLLSFLKENHVGKENAVKSKVLEELFGLSGQEVRSIVNQLRSEGVPICSGQKGYWFAKNRTEIQETLRNLTQRIQGITNAINGLKGAVK
jgi:biotin operon repressor